MKNRYFILLINFCLFSINGIAQSNYSDYSSNQKSLIYQNDFNSSSDDWATGSFDNGCRESHITNGHYELSSKCTDTNPVHWTNLAVIDYSKDFEIESAIKFVSGENDNSNGIFWGRNTDGYRFRFTFSGNGQYKIDRYNGTWYNFKSWTAASCINKTDFNKLTIRKIGDNLYFFMNEIFVHMMAFEPFFGQQIGFQVNQNSTIWVDYLTVNYLNKFSNQVSQVRVEPIQKEIPTQLSDVDLNIPVASRQNQNTFGVIIGNENYQKEIKVKFAVNDAQSMKLYMTRTLGIPEENINYTENATYGQMLDAIKWITDVMKVFNGEAKVIFYYAGHGMPDEQTKSAFLLPVDGRSDNPMTALKLSYLYDELSKYPSTSVTVFLDACFSGSARVDDGSMLAEGRGVKIKPKEDLLKGNLVVVSAASGDETAYPYNEKQHGLFTYYLLKKLQETKGDISLDELSNSLITDVGRRAIVINHKAQNPQINAGSQVESKWKSWKLK